LSPAKPLLSTAATAATPHGSAGRPGLASSGSTPWIAARAGTDLDRKAGACVPAPRAGPPSQSTPRRATAGGAQRAVDPPGAGRAGPSPTRAKWATSSALARAAARTCGDSIRRRRMTSLPGWRSRRGIVQAGGRSATSGCGCEPALTRAHNCAHAHASL
jgi:hypothetical protein